MRKWFLAGTLAILSIVAVGCTDNQMARQFGGTAKETLPAGRKLVNATWKQDSLWILTRPMREGEVPETHEFTESSSFGMVQGKVIFVEQK